MNARARHIALVVIACSLALTGALSASELRGNPDEDAAFRGLEVADDDDLLGIDLGERPSRKPTVQAAFRLESYRPGDVARLALFSTARGVTLQIFHAGTERKRVRGNDTMAGNPVTGKRQLGSIKPGRQARVPIGNWPTGFYFAQLEAGGRVGYAPFVLRPRTLGEHRVAVVFPTQTWQAYNTRDDDNDGKPDTWYGNWAHRWARLARPFENRGTPRHYRRYEEPFLRWLTATDRRVDYLSDRELKMVRDGAELARAYDLLIFEGHHEYVTTHEYDVVTNFRDRGGNLMFLAANDFFCRVDIHGDVMKRIDTWRNLGRPEAQLIGVQYIGWNQMRYNPKPYILQFPASAAWIFDGTELHSGDKFSAGGIEIDARATASPHGTQILATIPNVFGPGKTAEMTYYETPRGAKVFAAGAFSLGATVWHRGPRQVVENLWARLARP
jgi:hypothetical protein